MACVSIAHRRCCVPNSRKKPLKDPKGGLTAAGREHYRQTTGADLRPGVKGPADTPEKMRRKGSFLRRHFANPQGPLQDAHGNPTRLALCAQAWGEPIPVTPDDVKRLADLGAELLRQYHASKPKKKKARRRKARG